MVTRWIPLLLVVLAGCGGATRVVRLETGQGAPLIHVPRGSETEPVALEAGEFEDALARLARDLRPPARPQEAARRLFEVEARGGSYLFDSRTRELTPLRPGEQVRETRPEAEAELTRAYLLWCARTGREGDCLGLLQESPSVTGDARFTLALALAKGAVLNEMTEAFKDMAKPEAMLSAALWTMTFYAILWSVPEPATKGVATALTLGLIGYVGIDTFWSLIAGFRRLLEEAERAATFDELRDAGERFGKVMGKNAARAFAMLATAAIGSTSATLGSKLQALPGAAQAAGNVRGQAGVEYAAVGQAETVAVTAEGLTIGLAPGAVAMAARRTSARGAASPSSPSGFRAWSSFSGFKKTMGPAGKGKQWHHIVEQTPTNVKRFGPKAIHNTENITAVDEQIHARLSAYYSSKQRVAGGRVVREQSYDQQRDFGLRVLKQFDVIP